MYSFQVEMVFPENNIVIPVENQKLYLPGVYNSELASKENDLYGSQRRYSLAYLGLIQLDFFEYLRPTQIFCHVPT